MGTITDRLPSITLSIRPIFFSPVLTAQMFATYSGALTRWTRDEREGIEGEREQAGLWH